MIKLKQAINTIGVSRLIVSFFLLLLMIVLPYLGIDPGMTYAAVLVRIGMNGFLVLAMMISVVCGAGLNFGLPIGIICGLLAGSISVQFNWSGVSGFLFTCLLCIPIALIVGYLYGQMLNRVKGSEMTTGNYVAFSVVYLFCILWLVLPYNNPLIVWPMKGKGLRVVLTLDGFYQKILDNFLIIDFKKLGILQDTIWKNFSIPTGLLLFFGVGCILMWAFTRSKTGILMRCGGIYPRFSKALGIDSDRIRLYGTMASMVLAAIGIVVYSQSYGFYQFYTAPLKMAFPVIAALLIGGATAQKASVFNVVFGLIIYEGLLTLATPIANHLLNTGSIAEIMRIIVQNGIILYALTKIKADGGK